MKPRSFGDAAFDVLASLGRQAYNDGLLNDIPIFMQKMILISCSDGRITGAAFRARALATKHGYDIGETSVYRIKIPGPDGAALGKRGAAHQETLKEDVAVLVEKTHPAVIAVAGHCDCAGHFVSDDQHLEDSKSAAEQIKKWFPDVGVLGFLDRPHEDGSWSFEEECCLEKTTAAV